MSDDLGASERQLTPAGWSDTDWIKRLQYHEENPMACTHINQGSFDAAADAYEDEYNNERMAQAGMNQRIEAVDKLIQQAVLAEREACADLCEDAFDKWDSNETDTWSCGVLYCAGLIRDRSGK